MTHLKINFFRDCSRIRIRDDFQKNRNVTSSASQEELIKLGHECNKVLTEQVFQVEIENPGEGARKVRIYPAQIFPNHTAFFLALGLE